MFGGLENVRIFVSDKSTLDKSALKLARKLSKAKAVITAK